MPVAERCRGAPGRLGEQFGELTGVQRAQAGRLHPVPHETGSHDERGDRLDLYTARWRQPERVHKGPDQLRLHLVLKEFGGLRPTDGGDVEQAGALGQTQLDQRTRHVLGGQRLTWRGSELEIRLADQDEQVVLRREVPDDQGRIRVGGGGDVADRDVFVSAGREQLPGGRQDAPPGVLTADPAAVNILFSLHILPIAAAPVTAGR
jgi:hypothetical protein